MTWEHIVIIALWLSGWCMWEVMTGRTPQRIYARAGALGAALDLARVMIAERAPAPDPQPARLITGELDCPYNGQAEVSQAVKAAASNPTRGALRPSPGQRGAVSGRGSDPQIRFPGHP